MVVKRYPCCPQARGTSIWKVQVQILSDNRLGLVYLLSTSSTDFPQVEGELARIKRSVRKQIEKAKTFVEGFHSDLEIRRIAADAPAELLAMWEELKHAYQADNEAEEKVQDCLDKSVVPFPCSIILMLVTRYPKTSELIRQAKQCMDAKVNFPAVFERLELVTKLDTERKELQKIADDAKATRLEAQKVFLRSLQVLVVALTAYRNLQSWELRFILHICLLQEEPLQSAIEVRI
jgi:hypothetical protein